MFEFVSNLYNSDKQAFALLIQAIATFAIGILAWSATKSQNILSEKYARKKLFKLRFENIYQEINLLFSDTIALTEKYDEAQKIKLKKIKEKTIETLKKDYSKIRTKFLEKLDVNKFLIRQRDYDKLMSFCNEYLTHIEKYINGACDNKVCPNYDIATCYVKHYKVIPKILSKYLYYENDSKVSFWTYKIFKYFKKHFYLFLLDYFPFFCEVVSSILFFICLACGLLYAFIEFTKEILKAPITLKNGKINFDLKFKSEYLKRNRPWPL